MYTVSGVVARPRRLALTLPVIAALAACADAVSPGSGVNSESDSLRALPRMSDSALAVARSGGASLMGADYNFYNVYVVPEGMAVTVFFKYTGNMTPILTVGTTSDVYSDPEGWAAGKYLGEGKWQARVPGLWANHKYYYRLENLGGGKSSGSFNTLKRQITVDIDWVQVDFDGDVGAPCGELTFRTRVQTEWYSGYSYDSYTKEYGICSGYGQGFIGADGKWTWTDWPYEGAFLTLGAMDSDSCYAWDSICGDMGFTLSTGFDVRPYGTQKFTMKTFGNVSATFTGKLIVSYVP